jgi:hypothetical protein
MAIAVPFRMLPEREEHDSGTRIGIHKENDNGN